MTISSSLSGSVYVTPAVILLEINPEGILCGSTSKGSDIESLEEEFFDWSNN